MRQSETVRIYVPADLMMVRELLDGNALVASSAWAASQELLAQYGLEAHDVEMGEAVAMALAAAASRVAADAGSGALRRVVIALDVEDKVVRSGVDLDQPGLVRLDSPVTLNDVVSLHIDGSPYAAPAADELDDVTQLQWYDSSELEQALAAIAGEHQGEGN